MTAGLSRRRFLTATAATAAVAVTAGLPSVGAGLPILHGDGLVDDAPALNALLNGGRAVCFKTGVILDWAGATSVQSTAAHLVKSPIVVAYKHDFELRGIHLIVDHGGSGFSIKSCSNVTIQDCFIAFTPGQQIANGRKVPGHALKLKRDRVRFFAETDPPVMPQNFLAGIPGPATSSAALLVPA